MGIAKTSFIVVTTAVAFQLWPVLFAPKLIFEFGGKVEPGFEKVQNVFKFNFENNWDFEGSAFAVCHNGKMVVDLWGGFADSASNRLWRENTMTIVASTTKAVSAICLAVLVDRGLIKYSDLVTKHWPEFGQNGKDKITVKMLASHEAGLAALDEQLTLGVINDWRKMSAAFENQQPNWVIGTGAGYHAFTYGWLIDQIVRRVDPKKRSLGTFFHEEIAQPHNIDFYIGLPNALEYRVARMVSPRSRDILARFSDKKFLQFIYHTYTQPSDSLLSKVRRNPDWSSPQGGNFFNNPEMHAMEIGSCNGIGTARALAQLFCLLDSGKLLNKNIVDELVKPVFIDEMDYTMQINMTWGWGFFHTKNPDGHYQMGHPGFGGQNVKYDPEYKLSMAYVRNGLSPDMGDSWSFASLEKALYDSIKKV